MQLKKLIIDPLSLLLRANRDVFYLIFLKGQSFKQRHSEASRDDPAGCRQRAGERDEEGAGGPVHHRCCYRTRYDGQEGSILISPLSHALTLLPVATLTPLPPAPTADTRKRSSSRSRRSRRSRSRSQSRSKTRRKRSRSKHKPPPRVPTDSHSSRAGHKRRSRSRDRRHSRSRSRCVLNAQKPKLTVSIYLIM